MTRQIRMDFNGAWHHVMNRGANHQITFLSDDDRDLFLQLLARMSARFGLEVHAYCLMPNHYHLLTRSPNCQLSSALRFLGQTYTQIFNERHGRDGSLFRGRFHSILVDSDRYLQTAARYIHRNPVTKSSSGAQILDQYEWSSLHAYEGEERPQSWLHTDRVLAGFHDRASYRRFVRGEVSDPRGERFYESPFSQTAVLGDEEFAAQSLKLAGDPKILAVAGIPDLDVGEIDAAVLKLSQATPVELSSAKPGQVNAVRSVAVQLAYDYTPISLDALATRYGFKSAHSALTAVARSRSATSSVVVALRHQVADAVGIAVGAPSHEVWQRRV